MEQVRIVVLSFWKRNSEEYLIHLKNGVHELEI